jgi:phospholipase C
MRAFADQHRVRRHGRAVALAAALAIGGAIVATSPSGAHAASTRPAIPSGVIKHVVVIFQENHSFDETLGDYCVVNTGRCNGSIGPVTLQGGTVVHLKQSPDALPVDVPHNVAAQATAIDGGKMDGWGAIAGCVHNGTNLCLTYYTPAQIPSLAALADHFVVADRTFSMQDSPSWGGHVYAAAATQGGFTGDIPHPAPGVKSGPGWGCDSKRLQTWIDPVTHAASQQPSCIPARSGVLNPARYPYNGAFEATKVPNVPTIFDRLTAAGMSWRLYSSVYVWQVCPNFADCLYTSQHANVVSTASVLTDAGKGSLPAFSLVLPSGPGGTGQHPPASMMVGDNWISNVVNKIEHGPQWSSTAIFITYDDCGCFYDHVPPGTNPDGTKQGIRVPMVIVSPYAKVGFTDSTPATFASILHFTEEALGLKPLAVNDAQAYDYAGSFNFGSAPTGPRVALRQQPLSAATRRYLATHPDLEDSDDDT